MNNGGLAPLLLNFGRG